MTSRQVYKLLRSEFSSLIGPKEWGLRNLFNGRTNSEDEQLRKMRLLKRVFASTLFVGTLGRTNSEDEQLRKMRLLKRVFASTLFVGTLGAALYVKHRKAQRLREVLEQCRRLPDDPAYQGNTQERFLYKGYVLPGEMLKSGKLDEVKMFGFKEGDVVVASFPKSGTTWLEEIVFLVQTQLDFKKAASSVLETRFPYLEYPYPGIQSIAKQKGERMIKTHLPLSLLPDDLLESGAKVIYIVRNPKDVAVSYYHFHRLLTMINYKGSFEEFLRSFMKNEVVYSPYFDHTLEYWKQRKNENLLIVRYEDLKKDPEVVVQKVAAFLGKTITYDEVRMIVQHTTFENMSGNPTVNYSHWNDLGLANKDEGQFMRKGVVGDWKNYFTPDLSIEFDQWASRNVEGSGLQFDYTLEPGKESEKPT